MELAKSVSYLAGTGNCSLRRAKSGNTQAFGSFQWKQGVSARGMWMIGNVKEGCFRKTPLVVKASDGGAETGMAVVVEKPSLLRGLEVLAGSPSPFGATARDGGVNFAVLSSNASSATLCLFSPSDLQEVSLYGPGRVTEEIQLDSLVNKTGDVWHIFLCGDLKDILYGYRLDGKFAPQEGHYYDTSQILLDPYAKFDWEGDLRLCYHQRDLIIYEMHVRGFTKHESSNTNFPGTYLGVVEKLDHLKELGVNCIELMPSQEFNELEYYSYNSVQDDYSFGQGVSARPQLLFLFLWVLGMDFFLRNVTSWLMYTSSQKTIQAASGRALKPLYSSAGARNNGQDAINEFKILIREAHKRGIEVIMDVVFNHTAEGNDEGPIVSFRGIDNSVYYMLAPKV
ncbi:hypothetical protein ACLOJK_030857 [Asimina triloba]